MRFKRMLPCALTFLIACDKPPCKNDNEVFSNHRPGSVAYNNELSRQLSTSENDFWIAGYETSNGREYMKVEVQDEHTCATALMDITGTPGLEQYKKVKGISYTGAELRGVKYAAVRNDSTYTFAILSFERIID